MNYLKSAVGTGILLLSFLVMALSPDIKAHVPKALHSHPSTPI